MTNILSPIVLNEQYQIGIDSIDQEHQFLIDLYNDLINRISSGNSPALLEVAVEKLFGYADYHFNSEERVMVAVSYPEVERHRVQHEGFISTLSDMIAKQHPDEESALPEVLAFVRTWILGHILVADKALGDFVAQQHSDVRPSTG